MIVSVSVSDEMVNRDAYTSTEFLFSDHKYYHHATRARNVGKLLNILLIETDIIRLFII